MKKKLLVFLCSIALCMGSAFAFASCDSTPGNAGDGGNTPGQATRLGTPFVSISDSGLASWNSVSGALGYTYKINGGTERNTTATSVQLAEGQSIVVKAVGDGVLYSDSNYSNSQTFGEASNPDQGGTTDPDQGGTTDPDQGGTTDPDQGGTTDPDQGGTTDPDQGGTTNPDQGGTTDPDQGGTTNPDQGGTTDPDQGGTTNPDQGGTTDPDQGGTTNPDDGNQGGEVVGAPTYLGIRASLTAPTQSTVCPFNGTASALYSYEYYEPEAIYTAVEDYITNPNNSLGQPSPTELNCDLYAAKSSTIYLEVWLNNPEQYTILSLMINGVKKVQGTEANTYFYEDNTCCVYVAITTPADLIEKTYVVSQIEYVEEGSIREDGTEVLIDGDDSVDVGLWATEAPSAEITLGAIDCYSAMVYPNYSDSEMSVNLLNGWVRALLFDGLTIIDQKDIRGGYEVTFENLLPEKEYMVVVVAYYDPLYGNGVALVGLDYEFFTTQQMITFDEVSGDYALKNDDTQGAKITVDAALHDPNKQITKVEIYLGSDAPIWNGDATEEDNVTSDSATAEDEASGVVTETTNGTIVTPDGEIVVTPETGAGDVTGDGTGGGSYTPRTPDFVFDNDGSGYGARFYQEITEGILNGQTYVIRVYYGEEEYSSTTVTTPEYVLPEIEQTDTGYYYVQFRTFAMFGYDFLYSNEYAPEAYANIVVRFQATDTTTGDVLYDLTSGDENFFNTNIVEYYDFWGNDENSKDFITDLSEASKKELYFLVLENYFSNNINERIDEIDFQMWIEADLNDGLGYRNVQTLPTYHFTNYRHQDKMGGYDLEVTVENGTMTITESADNARGHIYKIEFVNQQDDTIRYDVYLNEYYDVVENYWYQDIRQLIRDRANDANYQPQYDERRGFSYTYGYYPFDDLLPSAAEYFDEHGNLEQETETCVLQNQALTWEVGYYTAKAYYRYNNYCYEDGEGEANWLSFEYAAIVQGNQLSAPHITLTDNVITWNAIENAQYYEIYYGREEPSHVGTVQADEELRYEVIGQGEEIIVRVKAYYSPYYEGGGDGPNQNAPTDQILPLYPASEYSNEIEMPKPNSPTISKGNGGITWNHVDGATHYVIYYMEMDGQMVERDRIYVSEGYEEETYTYYDVGYGCTYQVQAVGEYGGSELSNSLTYSGSADNPEYGK